MTTTRRLSQRRDADAGYTLVEMLVTIVMFTLVTGSITAVLITSMKYQTSLGDRSNVLAATRTTLERVDRDIRSANPLCYATGTEVTMFEDSPSSSIVDYSVVTVKGVTSLIYKQYAVTTTANSGPSCVVTDNFSTAAMPTTYYEQTTPLVTRTTLTNLTGATSSVFTTPSTATFDTCLAGGTVPSATTTLAAGAIHTLTVNVSVRPSTLKSAVTTSDCGTYIRNLYSPPT